MASTLDIEDLDLSAVAQLLARANGGPIIAGGVVGLTRLRDLLIDHLSCSMLEAERVLDTMIGLRMLVMTRDAEGGAPLWRIVPA